MKKYTVDFIKKSKNKEVISVITAYDYLFAKLFDGEVEAILLGDSLNMSFGGEPDTLSIAFEAMLYHARAVSRAVQESLLIFDMPFGTCTTKEEALKYATRVMKETRCDCVKIEGGAEKADIVETLTQNGIAVMGHIGLKPQSVRSDGGYKIRGKDHIEVEKLIGDAKTIEKAGAFSIVIEGVKTKAAFSITEAIDIPTIGIGASNVTDGQVIVWSDMLGFFEEFKPKFVRRYLDGAKLVKEAVKAYTKDVKTRDFPGEDESY